MKNAYTMDGDYLYVEVPVVKSGPRTSVTTFTASLQDHETIDQHRWRLRKDEVVTVIGTEVVSLTSLLLNVPSGTIPHQRDGNPMNYSRDNLRLGGSTKQNEVLVNGAFAYVTLPNAELVVIDSEDAVRVSKYYWKVYQVRGESVVRTNYKDHGIWRKVELARFVLNYDGRKSIDYRNGDMLDCRKQNLIILGDDDTYEGTGTLRGEH